MRPSRASFLHDLRTGQTALSLRAPAGVDCPGQFSKQAGQHVAELDVTGTSAKLGRTSYLGNPLVNAVSAFVRAVVWLPERHPQGTGGTCDQRLCGRLVATFDLGNQAFRTGDTIGQLLLCEAAELAGSGDPLADRVFLTLESRSRTAIAHEQAP
jgi:hypothetical protein